MISFGVSPMMKMRFCNVCQTYTLSDSHCDEQTLSAHPARFNPNDWYGGERRKARYGV